MLDRVVVVNDGVVDVSNTIEDEILLEIMVAGCAAPGVVVVDEMIDAPKLLEKEAAGGMIAALEDEDKIVGVSDDVDLKVDVGVFEVDEVSLVVLEVVVMPATLAIEARVEFCDRSVKKQLQALEILDGAITVPLVQPRTKTSVFEGVTAVVIAAELSV